MSAPLSDRPAQQQPQYPNQVALNQVLTLLGLSAPLARLRETMQLHRLMARVAAGKAFVVQGGSCLEMFTDTSRSTYRLFTVLGEMSQAITGPTGVPVVEIARIAGQFVKPRSQLFEEVNGVRLPSYRGPMVNLPEPTLAARTANPWWMLQGYAHSVRSQLLIGQLAHIRQRFASHEGLLLCYEEALLRRYQGLWFATSGHMIWIGDRTRQLDGAHVGLFARIANPIGVKIGPTTTAAEIVALCERLNPENIPGRLTFISRMGAARINALLPPLMQAVADRGFPVAWMCDPLHGNTRLTAEGRKTRDFQVVAEELRSFFAICRAEQVWPGGLHLEMSGDDVTECLGGVTAPVVDLSRNYTTGCDPRLNAAQSLDLANLAAELLAQL